MAEWVGGLEAGCYLTWWMAVWICGCVAERLTHGRP